MPCSLKLAKQELILQEIAKKQKEFKDALQTCYKSDEDKKAMDPKVKAFLDDPGKGLTK